jgi:hypothetical protein
VKLFLKILFGFSFLLQTNGGRAFSLEEGGSALPPPLQPLQACLSRVMAARPTQTKQNGGNQKRESHPLVIKIMLLTPSLWQLVQTKPNQTKWQTSEKGNLIPSPLKACLSLSLSLSLWQLVQTKPNKMEEIRKGYPIPFPIQ